MHWKYGYSNPKGNLRELVIVGIPIWTPSLSSNTVPNNNPWTIVKPTFYRIYKKKTTEGFQAIPYITALFSLTLWIYYAIFVKDATFLITINTFGIVIESIYIAIFLIYSPKKAMLSTIKIILLLNVFGFGAIVLSTLYLTKGDKRVTLIKWFNLILNICIFTSPLDNLRCVVKTKSVEFIYRSINCNIII
ncbi:hypothetical protein Ahy_A03g013947 [Arachis hypogaea]|uniref:Bidirectional sugar transporter SWEET n=1 Tax=Arachis hypogaea TaxID=3818 RepID=A0A445DWT1_ARAHY|nr:hypothetical protein Ahy_A03g013947 [Arachis hypogaea]